MHACATAFQKNCVVSTMVFQKRNDLLIFYYHRSLGLNTLSAYQRAKVSALKIVNLRIGGAAAQTSETGALPSQIHSRSHRGSCGSTSEEFQVDLEPPTELEFPSRQKLPPQTKI